MRETNKTPRIYAWVILLGIPLTGAGVDIYVPSLPHIMGYFHTSRQLVQLSLTIYLISYGIGQLFLGTWSDAVGRKPIILGGTVVFALSSWLATLAPDMSTLLIIRFIQGFAVSGIGTMTRALVVDCYEDSQFKKMSSYLTLAWATGPVLSPVLGGYLQHHLDWQAPFYFLTIYSAMLIVLISFMPEPSLEKQSINVNKIIINYKTVLSHPMFWGWIIMSILFYSFIVIFGVVGSFLVQTVLGYSAVTYGHVALSLGLVWFAGNLLNRFSIHFRAARLIPMVIFYTLIANIITVVLAFSLKMSLYTMVIPILFITLGASFLFSYSYSGTLSLFKHIAGTVSALMGAVLATGTGIISSLASILRTHNQVSMVLCYFGFVVVIAITYFLLVHPQLKKDEPCKTLTEE